MKRKKISFAVGIAVAGSVMTAASAFAFGPAPSIQEMQNEMMNRTMNQVMSNTMNQMAGQMAQNSMGSPMMGMGQQGYGYAQPGQFPAMSQPSYGTGPWSN